jgi:hypothetical protein
MTLSFLLTIIALVLLRFACSSRSALLFKGASTNSATRS